jgi:DnaK suppressor protein
MLNKARLAMTAMELGHYKRLLVEKRDDLAARARRRDGIEVQREPDGLDEVLLAAERDLAIHRLDREAALLRQVRSALDRMDEGGYGLCLTCEGVISPKRLAAVPWAVRCLQCEERLDGQGDRARNRIDPDPFAAPPVVRALRRGKHRRNAPPKSWNGAGFNRPGLAA